jgi:hypothetical protein
MHNHIFFYEIFPIQVSYIYANIITALHNVSSQLNQQF